VDKIAAAGPNERMDLFIETAEKRPEMSVSIVEKDFWVCWAMKHIFSGTYLPGKLVFKGGTSLSKAFHLIHRFSEDIDLSFDRKDLGFNRERDPETAGSGKKQRALLKALQDECNAVIRGVFVPGLVKAFVNVLGKTSEVKSVWKISIDQHDPQTVIFQYPVSSPAGRTIVPSYVRPAIRLELGARSDSWPSDDRLIKPYSAEEFPEYFRDSGVMVNTLEAERTFWEKATILHAEFHRQEPDQKSERVSRHYYDLFRMIDSEPGRRAVEDLGLLARVVEHKQIFFRSAWANYGSAKPGTLRLAPSPSRASLIKRDYVRMQEMIFETAPSWKDILDGLSGLEERINQTGKK